MAKTNTTLFSTDDLTPRGNLGEGSLQEILGYQLAQASIVMDTAFQREVGEPMELKRVEFTILQLIKENPDVTSSRLARALAISAPGITVWLDRLAERGFLVRERSKADARSQQLRLTVVGKALITRAMKALQAAQEVVIVQSISTAERLMLLELLRKLSRTRLGA